MADLCYDITSLILRSNMVSNTLSLPNWMEIKETLNSVLPLCAGFSQSTNMENELWKIFVCLEKARDFAIWHEDPAEMPTVKELASFEGLHDYCVRQCKDELTVAECKEFVEELLPCIVRLVTIELDKCSVSIPSSLKGGHDRLSASSDESIKIYELKLPRSCVASLIAVMFLCLRDVECGPTFPLATYSEFFDCMHVTIQVEKFKMVMRYFRNINANGLPEGIMTFRKLVGVNIFNDIHAWSIDECKLCEFETRDTGEIGSRPNEVLQTDFANKFIGGGVLNTGRVQEEIMFCVCPELQASMLFMVCMEDNEAIQMKGFEPFSKCKGYCDNLEDDGSWDGELQRDSEGTPQTYVTAIDAIHHGANSSGQYLPKYLHRELNKAYVGFHQPQSPEVVGDKSKAHFRLVATGNWGCGVFGGDPQLKSFLQWIAASKARCPKVLYYTFGDTRMYQLDVVIPLLKDMAIGELLELIIKYSELKVSRQETRTLFNYILHQLPS